MYGVCGVVFTRYTNNPFKRERKVQESVCTITSELGAILYKNVINSTGEAFGSSRVFIFFNEHYNIHLLSIIFQYGEFVHPRESTIIMMAVCPYSISRMTDDKACCYTQG